MFFEQTFVLYHDSGKVEITDNLLGTINRMQGVDRFHSQMKFNLGEFNERNRSHYWSYGWADCNHVGFYLCTLDGLMISPDLLYGEYEVVWNSFWENRNKIRNDHFKHNRSWKFKHSSTRYKHPLTQQARRMACAVNKDEGEPEFRGKRKKTSLMTYWDDVKTRHSTGWKYSTKRRKQYKGS